MKGNPKVKYDVIGKGYNLTRQADPFLLSRMEALLKAGPEDLILDIGCGTGNYTIALHQTGLQFIGLDPSKEMLEKAQSRCDTIAWNYGTAENTGLETHSVDHILATLTIHHWQNMDLAFDELFRVLKPGGRMVIFSSDPDQMRHYWLNHYFPVMLEASIQQMPSYEATVSSMRKAGFAHFVRENYAVKPDLKDLFLQSGKDSPELYFRPEVRSGISTFAALANREEVETGLKKLREDLNNGIFQNIKEKYAYAGGDYLFIVGVKPE